MGVERGMRPDDVFEEILAKDLGEEGDKFRLQQRILELLEPMLEGGKILDWKGHYRSGDFFYQGWGAAEDRLKELVKGSLFFSQMSLEEVQQLFDAVEAAVELVTPIVLPRPGMEFDCPFCPASLQLEFNGKGIQVAGKPCEFPNGITTEWELNVPSGKIVVANNLRDWFPSDESYEVNRVGGRHLTTLGYAKVGMAHGFVGNSCPQVYRSEDKFVIGNYYNEEEEEEEEEEEGKSPWGESVAMVCTDLWWYSIADYDELLRRFAHYTPNEDLKKFLKGSSVVEVKAGVYRFRQEQGISDEGLVVEYASFEWVREADPVRDYLKEEREKSLSATEVLLENCLTWPSLYMGMGYRTKDRDTIIQKWLEMSPKEKTSALAGAADHIMCVLGGGVEWHENGFPRISVSDETKKLAAEYGKVPSFDFKVGWYPIAEGYGGLCLGAGVVGTRNNTLIDLAPDFVELGLNICQNAILIGEDPRLNMDVWPHTYEIVFSRKRMGLFAECYWGLRKRYPNIVFDKAFDAFMQDREGVLEHIANFDFGPEHPAKETGKPPNTIKEGAYFEFDAMQLSDGSFLEQDEGPAPSTEFKEDAQRYALGIVGDSISPMGYLHMEDSSCREPATIPLKVVGRVLRGTGEGHTSRHLVVAFDYGTPTMIEKEWALGAREMSAVRQFDSREEYEALLEACRAAFNEEPST